MRSTHLVAAVFFLFSMVCTIFLHQSTAKDEENGSPIVTLFVAGQMSLEDIHNYYEQVSSSSPLHHAMIGEMNMRTGETIEDIHNAVTFGSGTRGVGSEWGEKAYNSGEEGGFALQLYRQYIGREPLPTGRAGGQPVLLPYYSVLTRENKERNTGAIPGLLGETLRKYGVERAVIGNQDTSAKVNRLASLITMDESGFTPYGRVGKEVLQVVPDFPGGWKTNYSYIGWQINEWKRSGIRMIVVDLGDLTRLAAYKNVMDPARYGALRKQTLDEIIHFVEKSAANLQEGETQLFLSSSLPVEALQNKKLMAPVLLWKDHRSENDRTENDTSENNTSENETSQGVLTSPTTRQPGIVANIDIAPTILGRLHIPCPPQMNGLPIQTDFSLNHQSFWKQAEMIDTVYANRSFILHSYIFIVLLVILVSSFALWLGALDSFFTAAKKIGRVLLPVMPAILLVPFLLLVWPLFPNEFSRPAYLLIELPVLALAGGFFLYKQRFARCFLWVGLLNWVSVLLDGFIGAHLMKRSYLGYDPVIGARYYGIGNEFMGVMLGSALVSMSIAAQEAARTRDVQSARGVNGTATGKVSGTKRRFLWTAALVYILITGYMAWQGGGSKAGGVIVMAVAFSYAMFRYAGISFTTAGKGLVFFLWILFIAGSLLVINDFVTAGQQSHIGRAISELVQGNWSEIGRIIQRKIRMNLHLLRVSPWSRVYAVSVLVTIWLLVRWLPDVRERPWENSYFMHGLGGILLGSLVAIFVNDSGITGAALAMMYAVIPLLYRVMSQRI
ncbi:hypothetical protein [Aneurinibacillus terranovensis]|uniref:hypothetical protein n=1 Tax=Aneurinibacillus terranovensis TaxID=278991 RepID=UPI0004219B63|nr:hypothetical protein [Aneurinibacillus terranovensis]